MAYPEHSRPTRSAHTRPRTRPANRSVGSGEATAPPRSRPPRTQTRGRQDDAATPATVWAPNAPVDPTHRWPAPILATVLSSFTQPGQQVLLLAWPPTARAPHSHPTTAGAVAPAQPDTVADAVALVRHHGRTPQVVHADTSNGETVARPYWTAMLDTPTTTHTAPHPPAHRIDHSDHARAHLVIAAIGPHPVDDRFGLVCAALLRTGGILAVLTHCDWIRGELADPTGSIVAAGQNADLIYLQHIVALHTPIRHGRLATPTTTNPAPHPPTHAAGALAAHERAHSDVLVFSQPNDHHTDHDSAATTPGDLR